MTRNVSISNRRWLSGAGQSELALPEPLPRGIGSAIFTPSSIDLIEGVELEPTALWPDDRGYFFEVQRFGTGLTRDFAPSSTQVSAAVSYPGTIKAFHYHLHQTDCWIVGSGMLQAALVDLRCTSESFGRRNTIYVGSLRPWKVRIPPGVAHGYKVLGTERAVLIYATNQFYNPSDEGRIPYNDPTINYDWETQHK